MHASTHRLLVLQGHQLGVVIELRPGEAPVWRHFGRLIADLCGTAKWSAADALAQPPAWLERYAGFAAVPGLGNGLFAPSALEGRSGGQRWSSDFVLKDWKRGEGESAELRLVDSASALELSLHLAVEGDVLRLSSTLRNAGAEAYAVDWLAAGSVPLAADASREIAYFTGVWANEFQLQREPLSVAGWRRESLRGRTSHGAPCACFVLQHPGSEAEGEALAAHLAWSGNHRLQVLPLEDGRYALQAGERLIDGEVQLAPGECYRSPELLVAWSAQGLDGVSRALHVALRRGVLDFRGPMPPRPVHLNTWEAVYFQHEPADLFSLAERAAALGIERFVLDDGWFHGRNDDRTALGDWWPDARKYPEGLAPLAGHVGALGMEFGLWVEPEMVSPDSQLYRAHPEWALQMEGRAPVTGRNQYVLDIARPEVAAYLFEKLHTLLSSVAIRYLKWDMNRDLAQAADALGQPAYRKQVLALYALLGAIRERHPQVEIESCASGGGRADFGILRHTQRLWTSDTNDASARVSIQSGALRLFPPEVLGCHVGPAPAHTTGRSQSMDFRCAVALFGHMGVEADVRKLSTEDAQSLADWISLHKTWRGLLHRGEFHQGRTLSGLVWWLVRHESSALLGVFRLDPPRQAFESPLRLPLAQGRWRTQLLRRVGRLRAQAEPATVLTEALREGEARFSGEELARLGLPLHCMQPESALIYSFEQEA